LYQNNFVQHVMTEVFIVSNIGSITPKHDSTVASK
jgi:hypothetical protein